MDLVRTRNSTRAHAPGPTRVGAGALALVALGIGEFLLTSRFGLLAGTVAEGVDPSTQAWGLNTTGWVLVTTPFVIFIIGVLIGSVRQNEENVDAVADLVS